MKYTVQKCFTLLTIFIFGLYSCEKELYEDGIQNSSRNLKITKKSFKDLLLENDFNKAYQKVQAEKVKSAASRTALEDEYNFTIDESKQVNVIEIDGKTIYNILIQRDTLSTVFFENLVLVIKNIDNIEEVSALIFKYNIPETLEEFSTDGSEGELLFGKVAMCIKACSPICTTLGGGATGPHVMNSNGCNFSYWGECSTVCISNSGGDSGSGSSPPGGSGTSSGGGTSGGGGGGGGATTPDPDEPEPNNDHGGGGSDDDEIIVVPVLELEDEIEEETPCDELQKFISNNSIQQSLRILKGQSSGADEHGNYISETTNQSGATYLSFPIIPQKPNDPTKLNMDAGIALGNVIGAMHCHTDPASTGGVPMFSPGDLESLFKIARFHNNNGQPKNYAEYTVMLSVGSGHYALKFKDYTSFINNLQANFANFEKALLYMYDASTPTASSNTLIENFLKALKDNNFSGVGLYKATEYTIGGITKITGWKEQILKADGTKDELPCTK